MNDTRPASTGQVSYLRDLSAKNAVWGSELGRDATIAKMEALLAEGLTSTQASTLISQATRSARHPAEQRPASDWEINRARTVAAQYAVYGLTVTVEETIARVEAAISADFFSSAQARKIHSAAYQMPPHPTAQTPLRLSDIEGIADLSISEGHYAVFDDHDVLRFYRIYTPTSGALKGIAVIRRYAGDNLKGLYPDEARVVLHAIDANPDEAAYRFSDTYTRCWVCGKNLTDSVSRLLSVGPTCRGFANHTGLRRAATEVDHDPARRNVYRALRGWALNHGFIDPRTKEDRAAITMSASRVASAWSGIPGVIGLTPEEAIDVVTKAHADAALPDTITTGLLTAPKDTLLILISSGVLSAQVLRLLVEHPQEEVRIAANDFFLALLGN